MPHLLTLEDLSPAEVVSILDRADAIAVEGSRTASLEGKHVALLFERPSTRTRVSFEVAVGRAAGRATILAAGDLQLGRGETIEDTARTLAGYVDAVVLRTAGHDRIERFAAASTVPVVNALTETTHPCQALTDLYTIRAEAGTFAVPVAYVGAGNNVADALMWGAAAVGMDLRLAMPSALGLDPRDVERARARAHATGGSLTVTDEAVAAVSDAAFVYTDVWVSMGEERSEAELHAQLAPYRIDADLLGSAAEGARVMHCLPAHRGQEIAADVIDGPASIVWDQARNRIPVQMAVLEAVMR